MKKLYACLLVVVAISVTSCSKKYNCTCTYTDKLGLTRGYEKEMYDNRGDAKDACEAIEEDIARTQNNVSCGLEALSKY
jgi:hypothetical protein